MKIVAFEEAHRFIVDCFLAIKVPEKNAIFVADAFLAADCVGHNSHGINRLPLFLKALSDKAINGNAVPEIIKETPSTALVDGRNGLGPVVATFCMALAIKKAKQVGIGWVCAKRSNGCLMMGNYSSQALKVGLVGIAMSNCSPFVAPTKSKVRKLGSNPLTAAVPAGNDSFFMDMATATFSRAKLELHKKENKPLPYGWAIDRSGNITTDPAKVLEEGALLPIGGLEHLGGYKGYSLGALVDILTGVLSGAAYSSNVGQMTSKGTANFSHTFIAIDPDCFAPCFQERVIDYNNTLRNVEPLDPKYPVIIPGDKKKMHAKLVKESRGVPYSREQLDVLNVIGKNLNIRPMLARELSRL